MEGNFISVVLDKPKSYCFFDYILIYEFYCRQDLIQEYGVWKAFNIFFADKLPAGCKASHYGPGCYEAWRKLDVLRSLNKDIKL